MRSRRTRKRYERTIPKPEVVIEEAAAPQPVSLKDVAPSRARERETYEPTQSDNDAVVAVTEELLDAMDVDAEIEYRHEEYQRVAIEVPENRAGTLIGKRGSGIEALEVLLSRMASHKAGRMIPLQADVNGYRFDHEESLRELARDLASRVLETGEDEHLRPMNGRDRRIVHLEIEGMDGLETYSLGEGAEKHIVIHREKA